LRAAVGFETRLKKLDGLRDRNVITQAEYDAKRKQILGRFERMTFPRRKNYFWTAAPPCRKLSAHDYLSSLRGNQPTERALLFGLLAGLKKAGDTVGRIFTDFNARSRHYFGDCRRSRLAAVVHRRSRRKRPERLKAAIAVLSFANRTD
jgi:hypothetical protein